MPLLLTGRHRDLRRPGVPADRQPLARRMAYLGCAGALGYGVLKVVWALGSRVGVRPQFRLAPEGLTAAQRAFDYWGTQILAELAVVILLGLVYPWGNVGDLASAAADPGLGRFADRRCRRGGARPNHPVLRRRPQQQAAGRSRRPHVPVRLRVLPGVRRVIRRNSLADSTVNGKSEPALTVIACKLSGHPERRIWGAGGRCPITRVRQSC